jgi:hypothetical protein
METYSGTINDLNGLYENALADGWSHPQTSAPETHPVFKTHNRQNKKKYLGPSDPLPK